MVSTRKRKSTRSTDDYSKKAKSEEELTATVKENEQQVEEQENQKTEEDSPTKKIAAANVLMAFSDTAGETTKEEADASGIKANSTINEIPAAAAAESSSKIVSETTAATIKDEENGEAQNANPQNGEKANVTAVATAAAAAPASTDTAVSVETGVGTEQKQDLTSNPGNNLVPAEPQVTKEAPAPTQPILPPATAHDAAAAPANPGNIPGTAAPTGVPTQHTVAAPVAAPTSVVESSIVEKGEVSTLYVGRVIGKGGEMIRDLQARSGCQIDVDQNVPHLAPRIITYKGTPTDVAFAKQLVAMLCQDGVKDTDLPLGKAMRKIIQVPSTVIGKIIGRGGEMIRELQNRSRGKIQVDHSGAGRDENYRQVIVTGIPESVVKAEEMITFLCANPAMDAMQALQMLIRDKLSSSSEWGSGPPYPNLPNQGQGMTADTGMGDGMYGGGGYGQAASGYSGYDDQQGGYGVHGAAQQYGSVSGGIGGIETEVVPCSKMHMGRVIGQKGVTINDLQKRSGCDIQINQQVPVGMDCQISMKGSRQGIDTAKQMVQEIIELGSQHPYAGGHGSKNQYGGQQGYQQQSYNQGAYTNPAFNQSAYPTQAQQPQPYTQQYGMPQQQQYYGGQPIYQQQQQPYQAQPAAYGSVAMPPATSPWRSATSADGQVYYYNSITNETSWDKPPGMP